MMAIRGAKPKPTRMKALSGTLRAHRANPDEPVPVSGTPEPPVHLSPEALTEWLRVIEEMRALGLVSGLDRGPLAAYCQAYGRWVVAEDALNRMAEKDAVTAGIVLRTRSGNAVQNPLVGAANKAMADMVRYAAEFGMTPSSRTRVEATKDDDDNPFAIFECHA